MTPAELLDAHVPGWAAMSPSEFRWAVNEQPARLRAELRAARDAVAPAASVEPPAPVPAPPPKRPAARPVE